MAGLRPASRQVTVVRPPRPWRVWLALAVVLLVGGALLGGERGLNLVWRRWRELRQAEAQLAVAEAETDSVRQVLWLLENDLHYIERVAREEYGMSRQSERIYRLPEPGETGD